MPVEEISTVNIESSLSRNGSLRHLKKNLKQHASPISPLSPDSMSSSSFDLAVADGADYSIEKLYQNICDMECSDGSQSVHSFTTYGNESRIDSELRFLVGAHDGGTKEDIKEVVVVEKKVVIPQKVSKWKKPGNIVKGIASNVKCINPIAANVKCINPITANVKCINPKPPVGKMTTRKRRSVSFDDKNYVIRRVVDGRGNVEKGTNNPDLGPYLLKKAKDIISKGDTDKKAFELLLRAKKCFENSVYEKPNLDYVMCLHILASIYCGTGQHKEAIPVLERAIEIPNVELGQNHSLAKFVGCMQLGDIYAMLGHVEQSIVHYKQGLEIQKGTLGAEDPRFGRTCRYVAEAYVQAFEFDEAEKLCQMALDIHRENGSSFSIEEAADRRLMGLICESNGNHEAALEHYRLASRALCTTGQDSEVALLDCSIGDAYLVLARYDEAVFSYKKALSYFKSSKGKNPLAVALVFVRLAELYAKVGKFGDSKSYSEKALKIYTKQSTLGTNADDIANGLTELATIYESMNELDQALKLLEMSLGMYSSAPGQKSVVAGVEAQIGVMNYMLGNYSQCFEYLKSSVSDFEASGEKKSSLYGITLNQLGLTCVQLNEISEAAEYFEEAKGILEREYGMSHPDTLGVYSNLAGACDALGRWDDALDLLEYIVLTREEKLGTADPVADDEKRRLAELLNEAGKTRRRKSRSLEALLDRKTQIITRKVTRLM
ncbi:hypothetical protein RND81_04G176100 [Saponaria officinalis]|uniref:Kinesin light chain n=1 Tax=Saponaria officinalis TaxID=3572 RepID=A0AAW1LP56_SAPOF